MMPGDVLDKDRYAYFMGLALMQAKLAVEHGEVPVGCIIVAQDGLDFVPVSAGFNHTNRRQNATRHAEIEALNSLERCVVGERGGKEGDKLLASNTHLLEYLENAKRIWNESVDYSKLILFVTIEPCLMCASALLQLGCTKVVYGASNDRFGGCEGVFSNRLDEGLGLDLLGTHIREDECVDVLKSFYECGNKLAPESKRHRSVKP